MAIPGLRGRANDGSKGASSFVGSEAVVNTGALVARGTFETGCASVIIDVLVSGSNEAFAVAIEA
jgi:hypothetical protein